jgi:hypothetical protein
MTESTKSTALIVTQISISLRETETQKAVDQTAGTSNLLRLADYRHRAYVLLLLCMVAMRIFIGGGRMYVVFLFHSKNSNRKRFLHVKFSAL